jgi:hypothetical protein
VFNVITNYNSNNYYYTFTILVRYVFTATNVGRNVIQIIHLYFKVLIKFNKYLFVELVDGLNLIMISIQYYGMLYIIDAKIHTIWL